MLAANRSNPCANRQTADELTHPLHIVVRYELERAVSDGTLPVADLEDVWRAKYGEYLGVTPDDAREGVLQDVHTVTPSAGSWRRCRARGWGDALASAGLGARGRPVWPAWGARAGAALLCSHIYAGR